MAINRIEETDIRGKRILIRADLNVPVSDGVVTSDARIRASLPTIEHALAQGAAVVVMSHLGRPEEGVVDEANSLRPVAVRLSELLGREIPLLKTVADCGAVNAGEVGLLENVRFFAGEKGNADDLSQAYLPHLDKQSGTLVSLNVEAIK